MDKSHEWILDNNLIHIQNEFGKKIPSIVLCLETFHKVEFLNSLINSVKNSIIFVDMDLLYTGYVESGMIEKKENVTIFHPNKMSWKKELSKIITRASKEKILVVIDSFNGIYNMFNDLESVRFVNSCIMLLSSLGRKENSTVIVTAMVRKKENGEWVVSPGGKQIMKSKKTGIYFLKKMEKDMIITTLEKISDQSKILKIE